MGFILSIRSIYILPSEKGTSLVRWQDMIQIILIFHLLFVYLYMINV